MSVVLVQVRLLFDCWWAAATPLLQLLRKYFEQEPLPDYCCGHCGQRGNVYVVHPESAITHTITPSVPGV
jgi:hypothetical protein